MTTRIEDALRQSLHPQAAPADLREGLLAEARRLDGARSLRRTRRLARLGLAAALVLTLGAGGALLKERTRTSGAVMAQAALQDFMGAHHLAFEGMPPHQAGEDPCACWSKGCMGFAAVLPKNCPIKDVSGGRACKVKGMTAACYLLRDGGSLYVFPRPIHGAPASRGQALAVAASYQASAWNEEGRGYVLVARR